MNGVFKEEPKYMDYRIMFLRELKESGIIRVQWISPGDNPSDIFNKI